MPLRRKFTIGLLGAMLTASPWVASWAATEAAFTQAAFTAAQRQGKPILVDITASWCPTCAAQRPVLSQLMTEPAFRDLQVLKVDFDTQKDVVRAVGARMQSTLIVFHGAVEKGRSAGVTDPAAIRALVAKAME